MISSVNVGGAEKVLLTLLKRLDRERFEPVVCVMGGGPLVHEVRAIGFETVTMPYVEGKKNFRFLLDLIKVTRKLKPDIIQSHLWLTNLYASACGAVLHVPVVATFHSNNPIETKYEMLSLKLIHLLSTRVITVSEPQIRHYGFSPGSAKVAVIMNGTELADGNGNKCAPAEETRVRLGLKESDRVLICVANLRPVKGHVYLLRAMESLARRHGNVRLLMLGEGELREELTARVREYGLENHVSFLGYRDDVRDLLCLADIFVCPSLSEATSLAILEAMAAGKPVVATNVGGNSALVDDGVTGFLVPPGNADALGERISLLLSDRELADRLGREARAKAEKRFTVDTMIKAYDDLYERLVFKN